MKIMKKVVRSSAKQITDAAMKFGNEMVGFLDGLGEWYMERDDVLKAIGYALLTKHHVLIVGKHGTAKSEMVSTTYKAFRDAEHFNVQCTRFMTEDAVFGIANIKKMQSEGIIEYNVEGMLPTAKFAFLDELLDANDAVLRSLLDILNERQFRKGRQVLSCPLHTAVATTNFYEETEQLNAVLDRFLFKVRVGALEGASNALAMFEKYLMKEKSDIPVPELSVDGLDNFDKALRLVRIPKDVLELYQRLLEEYAVQSSGSVYLSDRRKCWCLRIVKAAALLEGRDVVTAEDLRELRFGLTFVGGDEQPAWFESAYHKVVTERVVERALKADLEATQAAVTELRERIQRVTNGDHDKAKCKQISNLLKQTLFLVNNRDKGPEKNHAWATAEFIDIGEELTKLQELLGAEEKKIFGL